MIQFECLSCQMRYHSIGRIYTCAHCGGLVVSSKLAGYLRDPTIEEQVEDVLAGFDELLRGNDGYQDKEENLS